MPFDLSSAKPVSSGGFDLASARPVTEAPKAELPPTSLREQAQSGFNEGLMADTLGLPVDTVTNVLDLVKAGAGTAYSAATGKPVPDALDPFDRSSVVGSSDWIKKLMRESHMSSGTMPQTTGQKFARMGGEMVGGAMAPTGPARAEKAGVELAKEAETVASNLPKSVLDTEARAARKAGYVLPPTQANPTMGNKAVEGFGGKLQTRQEASIKNQENTNDLAGKSIGLKKGTPITEDELERVRETAGHAYQEIRNIKDPLEANQKYKDGVNELGREWSAVEERFPDLVNSADIETLRKSLSNVSGASFSQALDLTRFLRASAKVNFRHADNPEKLALAQAQREGANLVESLIEANLRGKAKTSLYRDFVDARQTIARSYDIESALTQSGNVSAVKLAALGRKKSFTGELETIANFGATFKHAAQLPENVGGTPMTLFDYGLGMMGDIASGNFLGFSAAFSRPITRKVLLSDWYQDRFVSRPEK